MIAASPTEYLVSYGNAGEFGRFEGASVTCRRGDRVVVRSRRGLEVGVVLCEATSRHAQLLHQTSAGEVVRLATAEDEQAIEEMRERGRLLFEESRRLAWELDLPLEVLDAEVSLDGRQAVIQFLGVAACDVDPLASTLAGRHNLFILMHNLALVPPEEEHGGCGEPNCGRANGGCTECSTGGGCATGCGAGKIDMKDYFAHLRSKMEQRNLTSLL